MAKKIITLDPGHGKNGNPSPNNKKYIEGTQMWHLANKLKVALEKYGFEVVTTRPNLTDNPSIATRGKTAGTNGSCMFLSLHSNAPGPNKDGSYSKTATGTRVYYSMTRSANKALADLLGNKVSEIMGHYYRGSATKQYPDKPGVDYYGVIRYAAQNGCKCAFIIEHGFHTCVADSNFLLDDANLQKLADAEAKIIAEYFDANSETIPEENAVEEVENGVDITLPILKRASKGEAVKSLQRLLNAMGHLDSDGKALETDGVFGAKTEYAVKAFQKAENIDKDGMVGPDTWNHLLK